MKSVDLFDYFVWDLGPTHFNHMVINNTLHITRTQYSTVEYDNHDTVCIRTGRLTHCIVIVSYTLTMLLLLYCEIDLDLFVIKKEMSNK